MTPIAKDYRIIATASVRKRSFGGKRRRISSWSFFVQCDIKSQGNSILLWITNYSSRKCIHSFHPEAFQLRSCLVEVSPVYSSDFTVDWLSFAPWTAHGWSLSSIVDYYFAVHEWLSASSCFSITFPRLFMINGLTAPPAHDFCSNWASTAERDHSGARNNFYWEHIWRIAAFIEYIRHRMDYFTAQWIQESVITSEARAKFKYFARAK